MAPSHVNCGTKLMKKENSLRELVLAGLCALALSARIMAQAGEVVLEDSSLRVAFDTDSGARSTGRENYALDH